MVPNQQQKLTAKIFTQVIPVVACADTKQIERIMPTNVMIGSTFNHRRI
jgi:hypothetical protein